MPDIWDELKTRIVIAEDYVLFDEATNAARSGAPRASFIAVWLSCAESLKRKFKDASTTDAEAAKTFGEVITKETKQQAVDAFVLKEAKDYGFISDTEYTQLENIYAQRCVYGHPYEQAPLPVQLHAAASIVVEYVLGRPTKLRHGYLSRQVDLICANSTYLDDHYPAVENCAKVVYTRSSPDIHLWFLREMWKKFSPDPAMALYSRRIHWFTRAFFQFFDPTAFSDWNSVHAIQDLTRYSFISYALATGDLFRKVDQHGQDIIVGNLLAWSQSQIEAVKVVQDLHDAQVLSPRQVERFETTLQAVPVNILAPAGVHPRYFFARIIVSLRSHDWYRQNPAVDVVRMLGPIGIAKLDLAQILELGNNVLQAAEGGCSSAIALITEISIGQVGWPTAFVEGLIAECVVNDKKQFRFKTECASEAMSCIKVIQSGDQVLVIDRIVKCLQIATPKDGRITTKVRDSFVQIIDSLIIGNSGGCGCLQPLRDAVAILRV